MIIAFIVIMFFLTMIIMLCQEIKPIRQAKKKYGRKEFLFLKKYKFAGGLNLPQNIECTIIFLRSRFVFLVGNQEISLPLEKVFDVSVKNIEEIRTEYSSNLDNMALGYVLAGSIGAIIGGMPSERRVKSNTQYLIFSYRDNGQIKYILFDVTKDITVGPYKFESKFKKLKSKEDIKINL